MYVISRLRVKWCSVACMCAQRPRVKVLDAWIAALNSAWGIDVYLFVVCVGIGLVTVT